MQKDSMSGFIANVEVMYPGDVLMHTDVSKILNIHVQTLYRMRTQGKGPPFVKIGKKVLYLKKDFYDWFLSCYSKTKSVE